MSVSSELLSQEPEQRAPTSEPAITPLVVAASSITHGPTHMGVQSDLDVTVEPDTIPERLLLGMSLRGLLRLCELVDFKQYVKVGVAPCDQPRIWPILKDMTYQRNVCPNAPDRAFWADTVPVSCGYDLIAAIKVWQAKIGRHCQEKSVCEFLYHLDPESEEGKQLDAAFWHHEIGPADIFYSHAQMLPLDVTLGTMDPSAPEAAYRWDSIFNKNQEQHYVHGPCHPKRGTKYPGYRYWVDYVCLRQCGPPICESDWHLPMIRAIIKKIGHTIAEFDALGEYLKRTNCIFELSQSVAQGSKLRGHMSGVYHKNPLMNLLPHQIQDRCMSENLIRSANAEDSTPSGLPEREWSAEQRRMQNQIMSFIATQGGFELVNQELNLQLSKAIRVRQRYQLCFGWAILLAICSWAWALRDITRPLWDSGARRAMFGPKWDTIGTILSYFVVNYFKPRPSFYEPFWTPLSSIWLLTYAVWLFLALAYDPCGFSRCL